MMDVTYVNIYIIPKFGNNQIKIIYKQYIEHTMYSQQLTCIPSHSHCVMWINSYWALYSYNTLAIWSIFLSF